MQIKTNLEKQDYIHAYKEMFQFILKRPVIMSVVICLCLAGNTIPFLAFPVKMAFFVFLISCVVCIVATQYRTGSLDELVGEFKYQQKIILPAVAFAGCLSWLAFVVVDALSVVLEQYAATQVPAPVSGFTDSTTLIAAVIAATLIAVGQVMPLVLAFFCHGLKISRHQGEHIWLSLMMRAKTFLAFMPIAQLVPIAILFEIDMIGVLVLLSAMYSTFLFFIVFNIEPKTKESVEGLDLAQQM